MPESVDLKSKEALSFLNQKLNALLKVQGNLEAQSRQSYSADLEDQAQEREGEEVNSSMCDRIEREVKQVKQAIKRVEEGEYGLCTECGTGIAPARLKAIPDAEMCIDCANLFS